MVHTYPQLARLFLGNAPTAPGSRATTPDPRDYAGGGPNSKSEDRTLPLVASPVQSTWTDMKGKAREANASPHISDCAMDVDAADLDKLDYDLKHNIPEFAADGLFPINSTQPEKAEGQTAVHINFKRPVF